MDKFDTNNLKLHIDKKMEDIKVNDNLKKTILENIRAEENEQKPQKRINKKKIVIAAVAAALIMSFPLTVGAQAVSHAISDWVLANFEEVADNIYPIYDSCTDNGIKIEVESAVNDSHHSLIFFTVQDIEGKGRVTEDIDLWDSYQLSIGGDSLGTAVLDSYDSETQTARFCAYTTLVDDISNKSANFKLTHIMYGKTDIETFDTGVKLSEIATKNPKIGGSSIKEIHGFSYADLDDNNAHKKPKKEDLLTPDLMNVSLRDDIDFVHISNIGFINGKLHIQTKWEPNYDNHGELYLCPKEITDYTAEDLGEQLVSTTGITSIDFATKEDIGRFSDGMNCKHIEYIFDVTPSELGNYKLLAEFVKDGQMIHGNWNINFKMHNTESLKMDNCECADSVEITPLGIYVTGYTGKGEPKVVVTAKDGSKYETEHYEMITQHGLFVRKTDYCVTSKGDSKWSVVNNIATVSIDGEEIYNSDKTKN